MKPRIPFRIGYQIDNWEKDLVITEDRFSNDLYSSYLWAGKEQKKFLNFEPLSTELVFHWDRLEVVMLDFGTQSKAYYDKLNEAFSGRFPKYKSKTIMSDSIVFKYSSLTVDYRNTYSPKTNKIKVMYFSKSFPQEELILKYNQIQLPQAFNELKELLSNFIKEHNDLVNLMKKRELTLAEKHSLTLTYKHSLALKYYLKKNGNVSNRYISFYLYFLFKDRRNFTI